MKTLQTWLDENKRMFAAAKEEQCRAVLTAGTALTKLITALPEHEKALRIIEAILAATDDDGVVYRGEVEDIAEPIINETQKGGAKGEPDVPPQTR